MEDIGSGRVRGNRGPTSSESCWPTAALPDLAVQLRDSKSCSEAFNPNGQ